MIAPLLLLVHLQSNAGPIPAGDSKLDLDLAGTTIETFVHKPASYRGGRMIFILHGTLRNADAYRDDARKMGERFGALIVAPKFDEPRFPNRQYHRGGILREDGSAAPRSEWTYRFLPLLATEIRRREGKPKMPFSLVGHSAGGQFLVRLAAFFDPGAERIVAANPGSLLFPNRDAKFGYGFGGLPASLSSDTVVRAYLARPLTLYLGTADAGHDEYLDESPEAMAQGPGRYQRGKAAFAAGQSLARERGWKFGWRLVETPGIGHDHEKMFDAPEMARALEP